MTARYTLGQTNQFQGTGVWSFIKFNRDGSSGDNSDEGSFTTITLGKNQATSRQITNGNSADSASDCGCDTSSAPKKK